MHTLTNLIDDIRTALAHSEAVPPERLEEYAREYARACNEVNTRLGQCLPHLRSGNLAEAIRLADGAPSVTEMFTLLDFEHREEWLEICDALGYDVPLPLAVETFRELNEAYLTMAPLEPLLKRHRFLALNGSPLRERLAVLRSIAKADPMSLHWQTDQETFEKARLNECEIELANVLAQNDMPRLQELYRELIQPWQFEPPPAYRQKVCTAVLRVYSDKLEEHFARRDHSAAVDVHQSMLRVCSKNNDMAMPTEIANSIAPVIQWFRDVEEEQRDFEQSQLAAKRFQESIDAFQEAIVADSSRAHLTDLYSTLRDTARWANQRIPRELEEQYRSHMDYKGRVEMYLFVFVGAVIVFILFMIGAVLLSGSSNRSRPASSGALKQIETESSVYFWTAAVSENTSENTLIETFFT